MFHKPEDYDAFLELMAESSVRTPMRILAYCLMPNHFHLALWPRGDDDVSRWMHWLMTTRCPPPGALPIQRSRLAGPVQGVSHSGR